MEDKIYNLEVEIELLKQQLKRKDREIELANTLINSYYKENKHNVNRYLESRERQRLSENALRMICDIQKGVI